MRWTREVGRPRAAGCVVAHAASMIVAMAGASTASASWFSVTNVSFPSLARPGFGYQYVTHAGGGNAVASTATYMLNIGVASSGSARINGTNQFFTASANVQATVQGGDAFGRVAVHAWHHYLHNPQDGSDGFGNGSSMWMGPSYTSVVSDSWTRAWDWNVGYYGPTFRSTTTYAPVVRRRVGDQVSLSANAVDNWTTGSWSGSRGPAVHGSMYALTPTAVSLNSMSGGLSIPGTLDTRAPISLVGTLASQFLRPDIAFEFGSVPSPFVDEVRLVADLLINGNLVTSSTTFSLWGSSWSSGINVTPQALGDTLRNLGGSLNFANLDLSALPLGEATIELRLRATHTPRGGTIEPTVELGSTTYRYTTTIIPTPAAATLLGLGGLVAARRRRD